MKTQSTYSSICKRALFSLFLLVNTLNLVGQSITNYSFTASSGTFTALTSPTNPTLSAGDADDGYFNNIPIGFDFWYMGARYTTVSASTNGWLALGADITNSTLNNNLTNGGAPRPVIAPLWDDLDIQDASNVSYKMTGSAPNRVFTAQYLNSKWMYNASGNTISFQVSLYEGTGKVEFIYKPETGALSSPTASIGITATATGSGNYLSVNNAGTSVSSTNQANVTSKPASGRTYAFNSPAPSAPGSLTFPSIASTSMTLNWADNSANEIGFVVYKSTDGVNYSFASQTTPGATSSAQSGLTENTTYYWRVYAVSEGRLSSALSGSASTVCAPPGISQVPTSNIIANYKFEGNANDVLDNNNGTLQNNPPASADRFNISGKAYSFNGSSQFISTSNSYTNPGNFTVSIWFKTSTTTGGKLIGFGNSQTGSSGQYDRHLYMSNAGQIYFGVYPGSVVTINSALSYNDNNWHLATATLSSTDGMALYIDGALVSSNPANKTAENFIGYWKIGFDNTNSWTSQPSSFYFSGILDDALIYHRALDAGEVTSIYTSPDGAGNSGPTCIGSPISLSATTVSGASYAWTGPNGFTSSSQNPTFTYSATHTGVYTLQVTLAGCTATAYTKVSPNATAGQWTGSISSDWATAGNWCSGDVPTSTTNVTILSTAINMPSITSSVACKNLNIDAGATVTTSLAGTLNIAGLLTNNGVINNGGTTNFNGTSGQQTFSGVTSFNNLTVSNTSGLLLPNAITINNNLVLTAGILNAGNFNITVKGSWTNNASTNAFTAGTSTLTLNGTSAQVIGGSFSTTFNNLVLSNTASTVSLVVNTSISGDLSVTIGTFDIGGFTANRASSGGILTVANNATLKIGGTNTFPTNYTTNTLVAASTVEYSGTNQTVSNKAYGNLTLSSASGAAIKTFPGTALTIVGNLSSSLGAGTSLSFTASSAIAVGGNVTIGTSTTFNGGSYSHTVGGNWVNSGTFNGNTGTITFTGPGKSVSGSGTQNFNNLTVSASLVTFANGSISLAGNLATISSGSFSQASGGTLLMTGSSKTINGSGISIDNLNISGSVSTTTSVEVTGNLAVGGSFTSSTGTITLSGASKVISGAGTKTIARLSIAGSITTDANFSIGSNLSVNGSLSASAGTVTFTGTSSLSGTANLFNATINGTSLQLSSNSVLGIGNALTITAGTLDVTSSVPNTVNFNGSGAQNINPITYGNLVLSNGNIKTALGAITTNYHITIGPGTTFNPSSYTHSVYGNWINNGTFVPATSTVQFLGPATAYLTGATTFNVLTSNTSSPTTQLILNDNVSAATVNMTNGTISTGSNTLTITNTRTGNGYIFGTIQRTHAFTTGVAYAFEGPNNTISFSAVSAVSSVTVTVLKESVNDFPYGAAIGRFYNITVPTGSYTATLRLHYEDHELNGNDESDMALWQYDGIQWLPAGKAANNTSTNYVEQSGLTNITDRWTISINPSVVLWNGSVSADWGTAANWTVYAGAGSVPPSSSDVAVLGGVPPTYQPTISSAVTIKNLVFSSTSAATLSMSSGGSLTSGDVLGIWTGNTTHTINANDQSITINGNLTLGEGSNGRAIDLNIGSGTVAVVGSLIQSGGAGISFNGTGTLAIHDDFDQLNGTFDAGNGTVEYNGDENQHISHVDYHHLTINKNTGIARIDSITNIGGNLLIATGELEAISTINVEGDITIASGATLYNDYMLHIGGDWNNDGEFVETGAHIVFDGSGTQTISPDTFNNLEIDKPIGSSAVLAGDIIINGDLIVHSGTLNIKSFSCDRIVPGGNLILEDDATFIVGANNAPFNFTAGSLSNSSTVVADGTGPQAIYGEAYGNIIFRNAGLKTLITPITVNGTLTIENGAIFDGGSQTLTLNGDWINEGTFTPSASTILCTGIAKTISGITTFNRFSVYGSYTLLSNLTFNSLFNVNSGGSISSGPSIQTTINGDITNSGVINATGTTTITGNTEQRISLINAATTVLLRLIINGTVTPVINSTSSPQFGFITINNTAGITANVGVTVLYSLIIGPGASFNGGSPTHNILGSVTNNGSITSNGTLNFIPSSPTTLNLGSSFASSGTVNFGGAGAITQAGGSSVSFNDVVISNTNIAGVTASSGWEVANDFTVNGGSMLNAGNHTISVGGDILNTGTISSETSTFVLNGSDNQNIHTVSPFYNLTVNNTLDSVTVSTKVSVNGLLDFVAGTLDLNSMELTVNGTGTFTGGTISEGTVTTSGAVTTFAGTVFEAVVNATSDELYLNGSTFNNSASLTKTGSTDVVSEGGGTFNAPVTISSSSTGSWILGNTSADVFNSSLVVNNSGDDVLDLAYNAPGNQFNGNVIFNNTGTGSTIHTSRNTLATSVFIENISVNNTSTGGMFFGALGGLTTMGDAKTLSIGGTGFTTGNLQIAGFTQLGTTEQELLLTGNANLLVGPAATFNGNVHFVSPQVSLNGATYNGTALIEKNGATQSNNNGGNVFNNTATIVNSSADPLVLGFANGTDTYNNDLTLINSGTSDIYPAYNTAGHQFNGNIILNQTDKGGIYFCAGTGTATLAASKSISVGESGFSSGSLHLTRLTQLGATPQSLSLAGTASLQVGPGSTFNGNVDFASPLISLNGGTYNGTALLTKTGAGDNASDGGNAFNSATTIANSGEGFLRLANTTADDFNGDVTFVRAGSGGIEPAYTINTTFAGNVTVNSSSSITFGGGTGTATFDGGNSQTIGKTGSADPEFKRIQLNKSGGQVSLSTDISVGLDLAFANGKLVTNAFKVVLNDGASISGEGNGKYVVGNLEVTRAVATGSSTFGGIGLTIGSGADDLGTVTVIRSTGPGKVMVFQGYQSINRTWDIVATGSQPEAGRLLTFSWIGDDDNGKDLTAMKLYSRETDLSEWVAETGITDISSRSYPHNTTHFSTWTLSDEGNPLPVELISFDGSRTGSSTVELVWVTGGESNNEGFEVEKSESGKDFYSIGFVRGKGTTIETQKYRFTDDDARNSSYYRFKQIDYDGKYEYSPIIQIAADKNLSFVVYPNPVADNISILGDGLMTNTEVSLKIISIDGQTQIEENGTLEHVIMRLNQSLHKLNRAPYIFSIATPNGNYTTRIIKL